jgi:hypothetical protein
MKQEDNNSAHNDCYLSTDLNRSWYLREWNFDLPLSSPNNELFHISNKNITYLYITILLCILERRHEGGTY